MSETFRLLLSFLRIFTILCGVLSLHGQSFKDKKKESLELLNSGNVQEAMNLLVQINQQKPNDPEIGLALAQAYFETNNTGESLSVLKSLESNKKVDIAKLVLLKAKNKHLQHDFLSAIRFYKDFLATKSGDIKLHPFVKDQIIRCSSGLKLAKVPQKDIIDNLGEGVNTVYDEFAPVVSPNYSSKLYFSSSNPKSIGGKRNAEGLSDKFGKYCSDIYSTQLINGSWTNTEPLSYMINGPRNEFIYGFTEKGKEMYIFRGFSLFSGEILVDTFQKNMDQVINPRFFESPVEAEKGDRDLFFVNDSVIIFSSNRSDGFGGFDLYISKRKDNIWTNPTNLGSEINSAYDEVTPFVTQDGAILYFSSNSLKSVGGYDIFASRFDESTGKWRFPVNQGLPLNSAGDDLFFTLTPEGYYGYFASSRLESMGGRDIFSIYYSAPFKTENNLKQDVSAIIPVNANTKVVESQIMNESNKQDLVEIIGAEGANVIEIIPLYYEDEYNLLTEKNIEILDKLSLVLLDNSILNLVLTCHSSTHENAKIETYLTIKRAEQIKDYLLKKGVNHQQLLIRGVGNNFPMIKSNVPLKTKSLEKNLSNRIDFHFVHAQEAGIKFQYVESNISKGLINEKYSTFQLSDIGLNYRVQISASSQVNSSVILDEYPEFMIEKRPSNDLLYYLVGNSGTFNEIIELRNNIQLKGIKDAFIIPYIDGWPISKSQVYQLKAKYPDLNLYIAGGK